MPRVPMNPTATTGVAPNASTTSNAPTNATLLPAEQPKANLTTLPAALSKPFVRPANLAETPDGPAWAKLYSGKEKERVQSIIRDCGALQPGTPIACSNGKFFRFDGLGFTTLAEAAYYARMDNTGKVVSVKREDPDDGQHREYVVGLALLLPGSREMPQGVGPGVVVKFRFSGAQARGIRQHLDRTAKAEADPASDVAGLPARLRVISELFGKQETSSNGNDYLRSSSVAAPPTVAQLQAIDAWANNREAQAALQLAQDAYEKEVAGLEALAK